MEEPIEFRWVLEDLEYSRRLWKTPPHARVVWRVLEWCGDKRKERYLVGRFYRECGALDENDPARPLRSGLCKGRMRSFGYI